MSSTEERVRERRKQFCHQKRKRKKMKTVLKSTLPCAEWRAESDEVIGMCACESAGLIIIGIAVGVWANVLEDLGVVRWLASVGCAIRAAAAVLRLPESLTGALAGDALLAVYARDLQFRRT